MVCEAVQGIGVLAGAWFPVNSLSWPEALTPAKTWKRVSGTLRAEWSGRVGISYMSDENTDDVPTMSSFNLESEMPEKLERGSSDD